MAVLRVVFCIIGNVDGYFILCIFSRFDRTLGGLEFTLRLQAHLAKLFNEQKKTTLKVEEHPKAMAKLFKEAERVKKVLSANVDHTAQVCVLLLS